MTRQEQKALTNQKTLTKDGIFVAVILAIAALASIVGAVLAILSFLEKDDRPKPEDWSPPPIHLNRRTDGSPRPDTPQESQTLPRH